MNHHHRCFQTTHHHCLHHHRNQYRRRQFQHYRYHTHVSTTIVGILLSVPLLLLLLRDEAIAASTVSFVTPPLPLLPSSSLLSLSYDALRRTTTLGSVHKSNRRHRNDRPQRQLVFLPSPNNGDGDIGNGVVYGTAVFGDDNVLVGGGRGRGTTTTTTAASTNTVLPEYNIGEYERREKRELEWLVRSTSRILQDCTATTTTTTTTTNTGRNGLEEDTHQDDDQEERTWGFHKQQQTNSNNTTNHQHHQHQQHPHLSPQTIDTILPVASTWVRRVSPLSPLSPSPNNNNHNNNNNTPSSGPSPSSTTPFSSTDRNRAVAAAHVVEQLLERYLHEAYVVCNPYARDVCPPNKNLYDLWIDAWVRACSKDDGRLLLSSSKEKHVNGEHTHKGRSSSISSSITRTAPERAEQVLIRMETRCADEGGGGCVRPDVRSYYLCLRAWVRSQAGVIGIFRMERLLQRMEETVRCEKRVGTDPVDRMDGVDGVDSAGVGGIDADMVNEEGSVRRQQPQQPSVSGSPYHVRCYNLYLYALANLHKTHQQIGIDSGNGEGQGTTSSASPSSSLSPEEVVRRAVGVLEELERHSNGRRRRFWRVGSGTTPNEKRNEEEEKKGEKDEEKEEEEEEIEEPNPGYWKPDAETYHQVVSCYAGMGTEEGANGAQAVYDRLVEVLGDGTGEEGGALGVVQPCTSTSNEVMACWLNTMERRRNRWYYHHQQYQQQHNNNNKYKKRTGYSPIVSSFQQQRQKQYTKALSKIKSVLDNADFLRRRGYADSAPDSVSVNTYLTAIIRCGGNGRKSGVSVARKARMVLESMEEMYGVVPDRISYNLVMSAYAKRRDAKSFRNVEQLLSAMETSYLRRRDDDNNNMGKANDKSSLCPDAFSYATAIDAIPPSSDRPGKRRDGGGYRAMALLERMEDLHRNFRGERPTTTVYNAVMNAWARGGGGGGTKRGIEQIEEILKRMEANEATEVCDGGVNGVTPDTVSYNTLLKAYSCSGQDRYVVESEKLLSRMETLHRNSFAAANTAAKNHHPRSLPRVVPDTVSYATVISAYARSTLPQKARSAVLILDRMIRSYESGENPTACPTVVAFNACLNACAHATTTITTKTTNTTAFANSKVQNDDDKEKEQEQEKEAGEKGEKEDTFELLAPIISSLQQYTKPDHITYGTLLRAYSNLLGKGEKRDALVQAAFFKSVEEGMVGTMVLKQIKFAASEKLYEELVGRRMSANVENGGGLPKRWSRNVRERRTI